MECPIQYICRGNQTLRNLGNQRIKAYVDTALREEEYVCASVCVFVISSEFCVNITQFTMANKSVAFIFSSLSVWTITKVAFMRNFFR